MKYNEIKQRLKRLDIDLNKLQTEKENIKSKKDLSTIIEKETDLIIQRNILKDELLRVSDNMKDTINDFKDKKKLLEKENEISHKKNNILIDSTIRESVKSIILALIELNSFKDTTDIPEDILEYLEDIDDIRTIKELERKQLLPIHSKVGVLQNLQNFCHSSYGNNFIESIENEIMKEMTS